MLLSLGLGGATVAAAAEVSDAALIKRVADGIVGQTTRRLIDRGTGATFTDSAALAPKPEISIESKFNAWFYQTWLVTDGMRRAASATGEPAWRDFGERNLDFLYRHLGYFERQHSAGMKAAPAGDGTHSPVGFHFRLTDLWHTGLAPLVMERYGESRDRRYEPYLARLEEFLARCPRLPDGTLHRPRGRLMADDPYMVVPYLVRRHRLLPDARLLEDAVQQVLGSHRRLFDPERRLYRHAWDVKTGRPLGEFWGRANGWMVLAQVELLAALPPDHPRFAEVRAAFAEHAAGLRRIQDPAGGWHQVLDHPESWLETSCTGMFVYGLARGVNEGWLDPSFAPDARRGWAALRQKVTPEGDIIDVCGSTDIGDVNFYFNRPRLQGDLHGFGPFLLAGAEMLRLSRTQTETKGR
jgi:unsaturated rhamnogalacturonyl hydrolase